MIGKEELLEIYGGSTLSSSLINSFSKIFDLFMEIGQTLGSSIRKIKDNKLC